MATTDNNYAETFQDNTALASSIWPPLTVTGITANNKIYDGTTTATLNTGKRGSDGGYRERRHNLKREQCDGFLPE